MGSKDYYATIPKSIRYFENGRQPAAVRLRRSEESNLASVNIRKNLSAPLLVLKKCSEYELSRLGEGSHSSTQIFQQIFSLIFLTKYLQSFEQGEIRLV